MPRIPALSLMPEAMAQLSAGWLRGAFKPRVAALRVVVLDAEHHAHGLADLRRISIDVREVEHRRPPPPNCTMP